VAQDALAGRRMAAKNLTAKYGAPRKNGCRGTPGPGRPKGRPNRITADVRSVIKDLVEANAHKAQQWFDATARRDPSRALLLWERLCEFVAPKLTRAELSAAPSLIGGDITRLTCEQGESFLRTHPELPEEQQQRILAHMRLLTQRPAIDPEPPAVADPDPPGMPRANSPAGFAAPHVESDAPTGTAVPRARPRAAAAPPDPDPPPAARAQPDVTPRPPPPTAAEVAAARRAAHEQRNEADAARRREGLRLREQRTAAEAEATDAAARPAGLGDR
jgi:hypothetical protein